MSANREENTGVKLVMRLADDPKPAFMPSAANDEVKPSRTSVQRAAFDRMGGDQHFAAFSRARSVQPQPKIGSWQAELVG